MDYIELYCKNYLQAIYHFCLKRTGSELEAEELASTINTEVIAGLKKKEPDHFEAWMWKVAKNCYCKWARQKTIQREQFTRGDVDLQDIISTDILSPEENYVREETLGLLRRELAFIKKEYRRILVFHYVDKKRVHEIAQKMNMPEGTIKHRLHAAKKVLKENLNVERKFGRRSYAPEDMRYLTNDQYPVGYMLQILRSKIVENILLEANNHALTREDIANALGIAGAYTDDEVGDLVQLQLLKMVDKTHYTTNFFIYSTQCQRKIYQVMRETMDHLSPIMTELLDQSMEQIKNLFFNHTPTLQQIRWFLLPNICDMLRLDIKNKAMQNFTRTDGGYWALSGFEDHANLPEEIISTYNTCFDPATQSKILFYDCYTLKGPLDYSNRIMSISTLILLSDIFMNNKTTGQLSNTEHLFWETEIENLYAYEENGKIVPKLLVIHQENNEQLTNLLRESPAYQKMEELVEDLTLQIEDILRSISNPLLHKNLPYYKTLPLNYMRKIAINDALKQEWLTLPENFIDEQYGACLFLPSKKGII